MSQDPLSGGRLSPLVYTKVRIPRVSNLLSRPRLLDLLHENIHRKLLLICAGPGYGKTCLLADFASDTDLPVCWYSLDPTDRDPRTFLDYLVEAVRVRFPSFGERTRALLQRGSGSAGDLRAVIGVLVNELAEEIPEYVVIALDDYHTVDSEEAVNRVLDTLLQYLPENVHLIVSGRSIPPLSITRLAAYGDAAAIGADQLRFTVQEAGAVIEKSFDLHLPEEQVRCLVEESEGWITGVVLRAQASRQGSLGSLIRAETPQGHVYAYLTDEVLSHLDPDVQEFLKKVSILSQVDAAFCDALLERRDSAQVLASLERRNLFLVPLGGGWYRFHGLFRDFLLGKIKAEQGEFLRLQRLAAQLWQKRSEPAEMIEHLLQAQAYAEAFAEIDGLAREFLARSRFQTLVRWIEALPEAQCQEWPRLLLFRGKAYMALGQGEKARADFLQAERLFAGRGDVERWGQTLADRAVLERMQGAYHEALETAQAALAHTADLPETAVVDLHRTIGVCRHALGDLAGAEDHLRAAVQYSPAAGPYSQSLAYLDLGFCLRAQGRMEEASAAYSQALEWCRAIGSPDLMANILNNLAMGPFLRGEFQQAEDLLRQALRAAQTSLSLYLQALVRASLGDLYRDRGEFSAARQTYLRGLEEARHAHNAALVTYLLEALGNLARQEGLFSEAHQHLRDALESAGLSQHDRTRVQVSLALLQAAEGREADALDLLVAAAARQEQAGSQLQLLRTWLVRALVQSRHQRQNEARESLRQATLLAEEMGVVEPFLAEGEALLPLLRRLPPQDRGDILQRVFDWLQARAGPREEPRPEEEPRLPLRILALGPGRVFQGEREISVKDWGYRQARALFFYLFFHTPARKEQIGLSFWPDRSAARVSSAFHAALYQARRAIGSPFVVFQEDSYLWNPAVAYWCDVTEFERLLDRAETLPPGDTQAIPLLEQAVALYRGAFLEESDRDWCMLRREELTGRHIRALLLLGNLYLDCQDLLRARETFQRALQADSFLEEAYRGLMRCHALAGERAAAIQVYRRCRHHLLQELQVEPSEETKSLRRAIARGEV